MNICRLCASDRLRVRHQIRDVTVQLCTDCGFVQVKDQPTQNDLVDLYNAGYFDHGKYDDAFALKKEDEKRMALIRGCGLAKGAKILDVGCATGDFIAHARPEYDMWGLDISEHAVREAQRRNPGIASQLRSGIPEEQDYPDSFYDAIVMWDVLEHLWDPSRTCRDLLKALRPGGYLFLSTPNIGSITARLMGKYWAFMTVPEHLGFFNRSTLTCLMRDKLGMRLVKWQTKGKWVNFGFLLYKVKRVFPRLVPPFLISLFRRGPLGKLAVFVSSMDTQYAVARKPLRQREREDVPR